MPSHHSHPEKPEWAGLLALASHDIALDLADQHARLKHTLLAELASQSATLT